MDICRIKSANAICLCLVYAYWRFTAIHFYHAQYQGSGISVDSNCFGNWRCVPNYVCAASSAFARQFPAEIRYSGISISVQLAGVLGGGLAPMIATKLLSVGQGNPYLIMLYIGSMAVVAIISTSFMPRDKSFVVDTHHTNPKNLNLNTNASDHS